MRLRRPLAVVTAVTLATSGLTLAGGAAAAPRTVDTAPTRTLDGITSVATWDLAEDAAGYLYVSGYGGSDPAESLVAVFAPGAEGDDAPVRTIDGAASGIDGPHRIHVGDDGLLYVANRLASTVTVHATGPSASAVPLRTLEVTAGGTEFAPAGVTTDAAGRLYVGSLLDPEIQVYAPGAEDDDLPVRTISTGSGDLLDVEAMTLSPDESEIYVTEEGWESSRIVVLPNGSGEVTPTRVIEGTSTQLSVPGGVEVDSAGNVYVVDYDRDALFVFGPGADGDVAPHTVLEGATTGLAGSTEGAGPWAVVVHADRSLLISNWDDGTISRFAPLTPYTKPASVGTPNVSAAAKNGSRTISWKNVATADTGTVSYKVSVRLGGKQVLSRETTATSVTLSRDLLRAGKHSVTVTPRNARGAGTTASGSFTVKAAKPQKVRKLKVKGKAAAAKRVVRWKAPAWDGGAVVKSYRVVVKQGKTAYLKETVKAPKRRLKVMTTTLPYGNLKVTVRAKSSAGLSPRASKKLTVKP